LRPAAFWLANAVERTPLSVLVRRPAPTVGASARL